MEEGLFRARYGCQSHGDSGSSSLGNILEAMELNWWPVVLHDIVAVGNLFLTGSIMAQRSSWQSYEELCLLCHGFEFAFQCVSSPAQGDFLSYFFFSKIT